MNQADILSALATELSEIDPAVASPYRAVRLKLNKAQKRLMKIGVGEHEAYALASAVFDSTKKQSA